MADPKKTVTKAPAEPVNSEQLESAQQALPTGPTPGELEERTASAEDRAEAAERENAELKHSLSKLEHQVQLLMKQSKSKPAPAADGDDLDETPVFDETEPHGTVIGDPEIAYVQNGYQFGRDKSYVGSRDPNRGVPRPFNPRLIGVVKPRPGATTFDALEGIRDT